MAICDYYLCDICSRKTFYDAELCYKDVHLPVGVGNMAVICEDCALTHEVKILKKDETALDSMEA